jgi:intracellular sulfur oxidation DsrE/DsrF family protein
MLDMLAKSEAIEFERRKRGAAQRFEFLLAAGQRVIICNRATESSMLSEMF